MAAARLAPDKSVSAVVLRKMLVAGSKKLLRTIANRKMLGKDREFCLSLHPQLSIALQRLSGIIIL